MTRLQMYIFGLLIICICTAFWAIWQIPQQSTTAIAHPAIHSPIEVFVIPLNDTFGDVCYDVRCAKFTTDGCIVILQQCPVDTNRFHRNISLDIK